MAPIGTIQLIGGKNNTQTEVELNTLAARFIARPSDFSIHGAYSVVGVTGTMHSATNSTAADWSGQSFANIQNIGTTVICLVKKILVQIDNTVAWNAAGTLRLDLVRNLQGAASGAGGTLNTALRFFGMQGIIPNLKLTATTANAGAGLLPIDPDPLAISSLQKGISGTAVGGGNGIYASDGLLFDRLVSDYPLILVPSEQYYITVTSTGVMADASNHAMATPSVTVFWEEYEPYYDVLAELKLN